MVHISHTTKAQSETYVTHEWHIIDLKNKVLGRQIPEIVKLLQGKHKVNFVPYLDMGDNVVVINAKYVKVTGKKEKEESLQYYSGYPGGRREVTFADMKSQNPIEIVRYAVSGMLPKNKLRDRRLARLHIFAADTHPFGPQFASKNS